MNQNKLSALNKLGQKIWIDTISREFLQSDYFHKLITNDGVCGITSNPAIFHKAISSDKSYQNDLMQLKNTNLSYEARYEALVIPDIKLACQMMLPMYNKSNKEDGYVSFEVSPHIANDSDKTISDAKRIWRNVNMPNLMIKIPATSSGVVALEELIYSGMNVNVTLLFSVTSALHIAHAYIRGLTRRKNEGLSVDGITSVASFFISRIDGAIDPKLPLHLQGKTAIALAKKAYFSYYVLFNSDEFIALKQLGAKKQFLLWASTGTKNKNYKDTLYVDELIGIDTINTLPEATLEAFRERGSIDITFDFRPNAFESILTEVNEFVDIENMAQSLQTDGLVLFENAYDGLMELVK